MNNVFKLTGNPYKGVNAIHVYPHYVKGKGYNVEAEFIELHDDGLYGKIFCREYYECGGDGVATTFECGRKSAKKEAEAQTYADTNGKAIAEKYLAIALQKLGTTQDIRLKEE